jgi:predicted amidohydrolase YtcJ
MPRQVKRISPSWSTNMMPNFRQSLAAVLVAAGAAGLMAQGPPPADLILVNGRVYTVDAARPWVEAVAIAGDRITHVGTSGRSSRAGGAPHARHRSGGGVRLPGLQRRHVHIDSTGALLLGANLLDVHEPGRSPQRIREAAARMPAGSWITRGDWGAYEQWPPGRPAPPARRAGRPRPSRRIAISSTR